MLSSQTMIFLLRLTYISGAKCDYDISKSIRFEYPRPELIVICFPTSPGIQLQDSKPERCDIPLQEYLLWNPSCQYPKVRARVTAWKVISTSDLQIGLLKQSGP
jgi:hypothetical protein